MRKIWDAFVGFHDTIGGCTATVGWATALTWVGHSHLGSSQLVILTLTTAGVLIAIGYQCGKKT